MLRRVGWVSKDVIDVTGIGWTVGDRIFLGDDNIDHMKKEHEDDYLVYGDKIEDIISAPDFLAKHPKKNSVEYIKIFGEDYVLVAVRGSGTGTLYARTLFVMNSVKVDTYRKRGYLKPSLSS